MQTIRFGVFCALAVALGGCGGGSGQDHAAPVDARTSAIDAARGIRFATAVTGLSFGLQTPSSADTTSAVNHTLRAALRVTGARSTLLGFDTDLSLYYTATVSGEDGSAKIDLFSDPNRTKGAGAINCTPLKWSRAVHAFPATTRVTYNMTAGQAAGSGYLDIEASDRDLNKGHVKGSGTLPCGLVVELDWTIEAGKAAGRVKASDRGGWTQVDCVCPGSVECLGALTTSGETRGTVEWDCDMAGNLTVYDALGTELARMDWNWLGKARLQLGSKTAEQIADLDTL